MQKRNIHTQIDFFLITLVTISAAIIYFSRIGLDNDLFLILKSSSLSYFIILFPKIFHNCINYKYKIIFNAPVISFFIILVLVLSGFIINIIEYNFSFFYFLFGFFLFFYYIYSNIKFLRINKKNFFIFIFSIIFSFFITSVYYNSQYVHPLMIEKIINGSWAHRDTLYHASIAGIFKTYFFIGTGLDGFVPHYYHTLSHSVFGLFSILIDISSLDFYSIVFPILITPIFFMFFLYSVLEVSKFYSKINNFEPLEEKNILLWLSLYIFFALPINIDFLPEKYQYLESQSYALALTILFLILNVFFYYINNKFNFIDKKINLFCFYFFPSIIFLLAILASYSKVSFVYLFTIIGFYLFIRLKLFKFNFFLLLIFLWLLYNIYLYFNLLSLFDGREIHIEETYTIDHALSHSYSFKDEFFFLYLSIAYIFLKLISLKIFTLKSIIENIVNRKILDLELLFLIILSLYIVPFQYFKGIQLYLSYILIIAHLNFFRGVFYKR